MVYEHIPVMYDEVLQGLDINPEGIYVDGTLGGGGHTLGILKKLTTGRLIANDLDETAIENAKQKLSEYQDKITYLHDDYKNIVVHLEELNIEKVDGILLDLGVSSYQIDTPERGFSYTKDAPLNMRMDESQSLSAWVVINEYTEKELSDVFFRYGEEKLSRKIASTIVAKRKVKPIETTLELANIVSGCYPKSYHDGHPAKRVFQAVRIEVNGELEGLDKAIMAMARKLKKGGRMAIISFHSLEDRIVKNCFKELETDCICDKSLPICVCGKKKEVEILTKKPITAGEKELKNNKRAESAKLRIIEKV